MFRTKRRRQCVQSLAARLLGSDVGPALLVSEFLCACEIFRLSVVVPGFRKVARRKRVVLRQVKAHITDVFATVAPDISQDALFAAVQRSRGVISGSVVLRSLDPQHPQRWHARDLDVFVPSSRCAKKFVRFLATLGHVSRVAKSGRLQNYPDALEIHNVWLRPWPGPPSPKVEVQVIVVRHVDNHVAGFDLAFLRNWCDGRKLVVGDISAVCKRRSAVSRWPKGRSHKFLQWLDRYSRRGYSFSNLRMQSQLVQDGVLVYLLMHDTHCVGVFFKRDSLLDNLVRLALDDSSRAVLHAACLKVNFIFRDFSFVDAIRIWLPASLACSDSLVATLSEIKSRYS